MSFIKIMFFVGMLFPSLVLASPDFQQNFKIHLEQENLKSDSNKQVFKDDLYRFYQSRNFEPVWFDYNNRPTDDLENLQDVIAQHAYQNGLEPYDYDFSTVSGSLFEKEWKTTNIVMNYISDLHKGRIEPSQYDSIIFHPPQFIALDLRLSELLNARNPSQYLNKITPQHEEYAVLKNKLSQYRDIANQGGWPKVSIDSNTIIRANDSHSAIPDIRKRLDSAFHEYDGRLPQGIWIDEAQLIEFEDKFNSKSNQTTENSEFIYDLKLARKVAEFQYFNGKKADGVIGPETIAALNTPIESQIDKIKFAMERWRWIPNNLGDKHVRVNIAAYYVRAVENGKDAFVMPIVVGKVAHQTPVFSSVIKNVKMHPDWTSPDSISKRYLIPKIQKNPNVVNRLGYQAISKLTGRVVPWSAIPTSQLSTANYTFRQKPGKNNALGLARFSIENDHAIFMHGTPSVRLFNEDDRAYSSGCVRLEDPLKMAQFLLQDHSMSSRDIENMYYLDDGEFPDTTFLDLKNDVPVHFLYMTAWVDQQGHLHFADDVYGRDDKLKRAFSRAI